MRRARLSRGAGLARPTSRRGPTSARGARDARAPVGDQLERLRCAASIRPQEASVAKDKKAKPDKKSGKKGQ